MLMVMKVGILEKEHVWTGTKTIKTHGMIGCERIVGDRIYTLGIAKYGEHGRHLCWTVLVNYGQVQTEGSDDVFQMLSPLQRLFTVVPAQVE